MNQALLSVCVSLMLIGFSLGAETHSPKASPNQSSSLRPQRSASEYQDELRQKLSRNNIARLLANYYPNQGTIGIAEVMVGKDREQAKKALKKLFPKDEKTIPRFYEMGRGIHEELKFKISEVRDLKKSYLTYLAVNEDHFLEKIDKESKKSNPNLELIEKYRNNIKLTQKSIQFYSSP